MSQKPPRIPKDDVELYNESAAMYLPMERRMVFIRKVYGIFGVSMAAWMGLSYLIMTQMPLLQLAVNPVVMIGSFAIWFLSCFAFNWVKSKGELATGLVLLFLVAAAAVLTGPKVLMAAKASGPAIVGQAFILTSVLFGGLTAYVFFTKTDFKPLGAGLFMVTLAMLAIVVLNIFFPIPGIMKFYSYAMILIFSGWVLYDTSMILNHYGEDEAVSAAASIFVDFVILFWNILNVLRGR